MNLFFQGAGVIEIGAQWVHGVNNVVYKLASAAGELRTDIHTLESTGYSDNVVSAYSNNGSIIPRYQVDVFQDVMDQIYDLAATDLAYSSLSLGTYVTQQLVLIFDNHLQVREVI